MAGKYVEGSIFIDGFFSGSKKEATAQFVSNFKNLYGTEPGIIEAQTYDAVKMMLEAISKSNGEKERVQATLADLKGFPGATGSITFNKHREAIKDMFILMVKGGKIVEIN